MQIDPADTACRARLSLDLNPRRLWKQHRQDTREIDPWETAEQFIVRRFVTRDDANRQQIKIYRASPYTTAADPGEAVKRRSLCSVPAFDGESFVAC